MKERARKGRNEAWTPPRGKEERKRAEEGLSEEGREQGNDEETEAGSTEGYKMLLAGGDGRSNGVGIIVNVEISKYVVRVERWQGMIIAVWMMIRQQMVCVICVY